MVVQKNHNNIFNEKVCKHFINMKAYNKNSKWTELRCHAAGRIQPYLFRFQAHETCQKYAKILINLEWWLYWIRRCCEQTFITFIEIWWNLTP